MLKKVGLVAAVAVTLTAGLGSVAFADSFDDDHEGGPFSGHVFQHPLDLNDEDILSGKIQIPEDDDSEYSSDDDVDANQELTPEED